jgi:hypothetical protein
MKKYNYDKDLFIIILSIILSVGLYLLNLNHTQDGLKFLESHIIEFQIYNTNKQKYLYCSVVISLFLYLLYIYFKKPFSIHRSIIYIAIIIIPIITINNILFSIAFFISLIYFNINKKIEIENYLHNTIVKKIALTLLLLLFILLFLYPLYLAPIIINNGLFVHYESHYSVTLIPGLDICCSGDHKMERANYGLLLPLLSAIINKALIIFQGAPNLVLTVQIFQITSILLIFLLIYNINKRYYIYLWLLAIILLPNLNNFSNAIYTPNQAGIRFISLLIGLNILVLIKTINYKTINLLAITAATCIIFNPETGIVLCGGIALYIILKSNSIINLPKLNFIYLLIFIILFIIYYIPLNLGSQHLFYSKEAVGIFTFFKLFSSGYGGLSNNLSLYALLVFIIASYSLSNGIVLLKARELNHNKDSLIASIGLMMLLWLTYYINRMDYWNLWLNNLFIIILLSAVTSHIDLNKTNCCVSFQRKLLNVLMLTALIGILIESLLISIPKIYALNTKSACNFELVKATGFCFRDKSESHQILKRIEYLNNIKDKNRYLILSNLSAQIRVRHFNSGFPWYDPFAEVITRKDFASLIDWIETHNVEYILTDNFNSELSNSVPNKTKHLKEIIEYLPNYRLIEASEEWLIYKKTP